MAINKALPLTTVLNYFANNSAENIYNSNKDNSEYFFYNNGNLFSLQVIIDDYDVDNNAPVYVFLLKNYKNVNLKHDDINLLLDVEEFYMNYFSEIENFFT